MSYLEHFQARSGEPCSHLELRALFENRNKFHIHACRHKQKRDSIKFKSDRIYKLTIGFDLATSTTVQNVRVVRSRTATSTITVQSLVWRGCKLISVDIP